MNQAASKPIYVPETAQVASTMLAQLRGAHHNLRAEIANMEVLTAEAELDASRCMAGRWKISQASLARRTLSARICDYFLTRCTLAESQDLQALREADRAMLRKSAAHVVDWTATAILADWARYCAASRAIRAEMLKLIAREQAVLCPLLERSAGIHRHGNGASDGARTRDLRRDRPAL